ncbi:MAG: ethanolamine utilization protein [Candidatus Accumulibacter sp.]|nr:ethanolamine utilization protein [Accumulibacter sp.]
MSKEVSSLIFREPLAFVDLETTGANFVNDRVIEIGLVEADENGVREWSALVDPGRPVPAFITGLTGIDTAMVAGAPSFAQLAPALFERLRGRLFVAHNARFDYGFLKHEFRRAGLDFRATRLCTVKLSRALFPEHHRHNLDAVAKRHGLSAGDERHRALGDARLLWELWQRWHALRPAEAIRAAVERITGRPELPPWIDPEPLEDLPEAPGAYAVLDEAGVPFAVRRAANLRQQVFAHFLPEKRDTALVRRARRVEWIEAAGELGARLCEIGLSAGRRRPAGDLCAWRLVRDGEGFVRPALTRADEADFGRAEDLFGPYPSPKEAVRALRKLAEAHHLCLALTGLAETAPGQPCAAYKQRACRGACVGKESPSMHAARLMAALAKHRIRPWPHPGPIALVERDEFGMREEAHVIDGWRYFGSAEDEAALHSLFAEAVARRSSPPPFDPEIYRIVAKSLREARHRIVAGPRRGEV